MLLANSSSKSGDSRGLQCHAKEVQSLWWAAPGPCVIHQVLSAVILTLFRGALTRAVPQRRVKRAGSPDLDPLCAGGGLEGRRTQSLVLVSERQGEPWTLYNKTHALMIQTHAFITIIHPRQILYTHRHIFLVPAVFSCRFREGSRTGGRIKRPLPSLPAPRTG